MGYLPPYYIQPENRSGLFSQKTDLKETVWGSHRHTIGSKTTASNCNIILHLLNFLLFNMLLIYRYYKMTDSYSGNDVPVKQDNTQIKL